MITSNLTRRTIVSLPTSIRIPSRLVSTTLIQTRSITKTAIKSVQYRRFGDPLERRPYPKSNQSIISTNLQQKFNPFKNFRRPPTILIIIGGGGIIYYLSHLEQVEGTGRWRFMDVSTSSEIAMGVQSFNQIMAENRSKILPKNHPTQIYVQKVAKRLVQANNLDQSINWEVHVIQDSQMNAFVLPGGKIFVYTGILPVTTSNESGLAVILGHEIAHQTLKHSAERMSSVKVLMGLSILLDSLGLDIGISRILLNLILTLPNSRTAESEADYIGLKLANQACFDIREAENVWKRMERAEESGGAAGGKVDFLSTHPSSGKRIVKVREWAEEIRKDRPSQCNEIENQFGSFMQSSSNSNRSWRQ